MRKLLTLTFMAALSVAFGGQQIGASAGFQSFSTKVSALRKIDGFLPLYWDERAGKMWLEIDRFDQELLYITALSAGVGSNDLGLDRGRMNQPKVVQFRRFGPKVLLIESNYGYRASSNDAGERRAAADSFARSTLWGFEVAAEDGSRVLVDASSFLLRDASGVGDDLRRQKQGAYKVEPSRSAFELSLTKGFPKNTEIETTLTFVGDPEGLFVREVTPSPEAITVREHQAFVALPEAGYQPRRLDPRAGFFSVDFMDFSAPVDQPVMQHYIARHRLEKSDPGAPVSEAVKPIIYYVDSGAPEPIRSALVEGASWWNQAFEAAGFRNAFQVKILPPEVDPMDVRYNVIQWVHRSTRGWSYGSPLLDPRTGEIVKGIVTLGSLRARQDFLIFQGLLAPYAPGSDGTKVITDAVYARLRQLAAHEVGHTLGLEHNYIASTEGRASVMDYPGPRVEIKADQSLDLSQAYATGIGAWDKVAIAWGYTQFSAGTDEQTALNKVLGEAAKRGLTFITDADSRPPGSAHPKSHLWDNGTNASDELDRTLKIRALALSRFGENNIPLGAPMSTLDEVLVPLYFSHRYQTEATAKILAGNEYTYALRGDGQPVTQIVPAAEQRHALQCLLKTIDPATLTLPDRVLALIPPRPPGFPRTRETFPNHTGVTFDPLAGAEAAANLTVSLLLNPERAARLEEYHSRDPQNPGFEEVVDALLNATWNNHANYSGLQARVAETVQTIVLERLLALAADSTAAPDVRVVAANQVDRFKQHSMPYYAQVLIATFEKNPKDLQVPAPAEVPPGQPIGDDEEPAPF